MLPMFRRRGWPIHAGTHHWRNRADASHTHTSLELALCVLPACGRLGLQYIADVYHKVRVFVVPATVADAI